MSNAVNMRNMSRTTLPNVAEGHITIGKDRKITVPEKLKRIAVQYDHNVETVTFDCPRFWDGLDMSAMSVYINYLCANRTNGTFPAVNVSPDNRRIETMHFDWIISKNVSMNPGKISFQVCIKKTDADGNEEIHWNSEICKDCYVTESLVCSDASLDEVYPDMFEQWHREWEEYVNSGEFTGPAGVSPTITVTDIEGGHRLIITDINGTKTIDVMDTVIEADEAVLELLSNIVSLGTSEPNTAPAIWFDTTGTNGESGVLRIKGADGTAHAFYPITKAENIDGVTSIQNGGTGASDAATARANLGAAAENHEHEDLNALKDHFENGVTSIAHGGTGASDAETARRNLGAAAEVHTHSTINPDDCGTELPAAGTPNRIFYKKVIVDGV